ncbi:MAG: hypothetical protein NT076_03065 [Candidatus Pacearchaeota archaeon]|nr:hypothetical protein [Candidatus Pacearchaeota archaeon]
MKCDICGETTELLNEDSKLETLNYKWRFCGNCYTELEDMICYDIKNIRKRTKENSK